MAKVLGQTGGQASRAPGACPSGGALTAKQSRRMSLVEAIANVMVGFAVALLTQIIVFPMFDVEVTLGENLAIGALFTLASICRSFVLRRVFEAIRVRSVADVHERTVRPKQNAGIGLPQIALLHAGRADRHARHR